MRALPLRMSKEGTTLMTTIPPWTLDEFLERRFELPEAGQWSELIDGEVVHFQPPDIDHGTVVLNLSKAFSKFAHATELGYACFDLGLRLRSGPDTIQFPAACYFVEGPRFAEADKEVTDVVPAVVVELTSTSDRVAQSTLRTAAYLRWGVSAVWTINPRERTVTIAHPSDVERRLTTADWLEGAPQLPQFRLPVADLFVEPEWWLRPTKRG